MFIGKKPLTFMLLFASHAVFAAQPLATEEFRFLGYRLEAPPEAGSFEHDRDFLRLHELQDHRTPDDCVGAGAQSRLTLDSGFGPATGVLTREELEDSQVLAAAVIAKAMIPVVYFKKRFQRPRPYRADSSLSPCISKPKFGNDAYPSGHSTIGYALALVLAEKFPEKRELILKQGIKIGENRVIGGVHHPSDVIAGRKLAEQVVRGKNWPRRLLMKESKG
ncbi:MAG: phosphatase PAP2 family protein [Bdellovibrionales bacterium]|nr:phosphatase PAP2 family protein [Bdellovibrionales bacterium]